MNSDLTTGDLNSDLTSSGKLRSTTYSGPGDSYPAPDQHVAAAREGVALRGGSFVSHSPYLLSYSPRHGDMGVVSHNLTSAPKQGRSKSTKSTKKSSLKKSVSSTYVRTYLWQSQVENEHYSTVSGLIR